MNLFGYFVDKPKLVNAMTILLLVLGLLAVTRIKREAYPRVDFDILFITTAYPGAAPEDVEVNVTIPLEEKVRGLDGLKKVESVSREGLSTITVTLDPDAGDKAKIKEDVQKAVDQVTDLPAEVINRPTVWELKTDNFSAIQIALSSNQLDEAQVRELGRTLKRRLERLPSVARIELQGYRQREVQVQADLDQLRANYLSLADVVNVLRARNVRVPAGEVRDRQQAYNVVTEAKFDNLEELRNTILRINFEGQQVRVRDVAQVEDTFARRTELIKMNGALGVTLNVLKKSGADAIRAVDQVRRETDAFAREAGDRLEVAYINDASKPTRSTLGILVQDATLGTLLVIALLLIYLDWRTALWTALGIPLALGAALFIMVLGGLSLNNNSLVGLVIVLGLLVDDSIVLAESIYTQRLRGATPAQAAKAGLRAIALPVLATVATTAVAFLPFVMVPGILGKFIRPIPIVILLALLGSVFESFFILPNHLSGHERSGEGMKKALQDRPWFPPVREAYGRLLAVAVRHRGWGLLAFAILFVLTLSYAFTRMKFEVFPQQSLELMVFYLEAQRGTPLERMDAITRQAEAVILAQPAGSVDSFTTQIARGRNELPENENLATLTLYFPPAAEQKVKDPRAIVAEVRRALDAIPELTGVVQEEAKYGAPSYTDIEVRLLGNDNAARARLTAETEAFLGSFTEARDLENSAKPGKPELVLTFDHERLARYGLNEAEVGLAVRTALEGTVVTRSYTPEERIDTRVLLQRRFREDPATLERMYVTNQQRALVPIRSVVEVARRDTVARIDHFDGDRVTRVFANLDRKRLTPVQMNAKLREFFRQAMPRYPGLRYELGGGAQQSAEAFRDVGVAFLLALGLIYFILVLQFDSFLQPLLIMTAIPFGILGVVLTFAVHGLTFSLLAFVGMVGLSGVVVNDSIILVDRINERAREKGCHSFEDYEQAALLGAKDRLRAIMTTATTTVVGVLPTAYGLGGYVEQIAPMVLGIGWGLIVAATLTLFLMPGLYLFEVQAEMKLAEWFPWLPFKTQCENPFADVTKPAKRRRAR